MNEPRPALQHESDATSCLEIADALQAYADGIAETVTREQVEAHTRACPRCAVELDKLRALMRGLAAWGEVPPPPELWGRIARATVPAAAPLTLRGMLAVVLLTVYDLELAQHTRERGDARLREGGHHDALAGIAAGVLAVISVFGNLAFGLPWTALVALPLLWLASTRLEQHWRTADAAMALALAAFAGLGLEAARWSQALAAPPLALVGALTALAVLQGLGAPQLRPLVLGGWRVPIAARTGALCLFGVLLARPDLVGALAVAPVAAGALAAAGVAWRTRHRRAA